MSSDEKKHAEFVNVPMTKEELLAFMNLMSVTSKTYEMLSVQAIEQNDEGAYAVLTARQKLAKYYADKLVGFYSMPEPTSPHMH